MVRLSTRECHMCSSSAACWASQRSVSGRSTTRWRTGPFEDGVSTTFIHGSAFWPVFCSNQPGFPTPWFQWMTASGRSLIAASSGPETAS